MLFLAAGIERETDNEYLVSLYQRYYRILKKKAYEILSNYDLANDMVQTALLKLIPHIEKLRDMDEPALRVYLVKTVIRVSLDYVKKHSSRFWEYQSLPFDQISGDAPIIEIIENKVTAEEILSRLDRKKRDLLIYRYFMGYSHEEIAEVMHLNPRNVNTYLQRAKKAALKLWKARNDSE